MKPLAIHSCQQLQGIVRPPGDKSISHRAAIFAALAKGTTKIRNFLFSDDCLVTLKVLRFLGVQVFFRKDKNEVLIHSQGFLKPPPSSLWMGESGTSARILMGVLAGQNFPSELKAASSLLKRPMRRVLEPLRGMGAVLEATRRGREEYLPCKIFPAKLHAIQWAQKIPSAQVKSAILLAGLFAQGETSVFEATTSRDHTERMLRFFKAHIKIQNKKIKIKRSILKSPGEICVPGDISSAAFFIVAALLVKNSRLLIKNVGINPTRMGILKVLKRMGAHIKVSNRRDIYEPVADIEVKTSMLKATVIKAKEIPSLIDELPILMVAAGLARGTTTIEGVQELRIKETDRIRSMQYNLIKLGVNIRVKSLKKNEIIQIMGVRSFHGADLKSFGDHRTAMSMIVAALSAEGKCCLDDVSCISKSFPEFLTLLKTSSCIS